MLVRATSPVYSVPSLAAASGFAPAKLRALLDHHHLALIGQPTPRQAPGRHVRGSFADALRLLTVHRLMVAGLSIPDALDALRALDTRVLDVLQGRNVTAAVLAAHLQDMALVADVDAELGGLIATIHLIGAALPSPHHGVLLVIDLGALADLAIRRLRDCPVRRRQPMPHRTKKGELLCAAGTANPRVGAMGAHYENGRGMPSLSATAGPESAQPSKELT